MQNEIIESVKLWKIEKEIRMSETLETFVQALLALDRLKAKAIQNAFLKKQAAITFIEEVIVVALETIGEGWQKGEYALSQVYMAGRICEQLVDELLPPGDPNRKDQPKIAICVLKDHHKLGKSIVYSLLRASGFEVLDYGVVNVDDLVQRVEKDQLKILLISVLMLPSALKVKQVTEKLNTLNLNVKVVVGGAPFRLDPELWKRVGAHAMGKTASETIAIIEEIMGKIRGEGG